MRDHRSIEEHVHPTNRPRGCPPPVLRARGGSATRPHRHLERGPLRRVTDDRLLGGVAGALSRRTGVDPTIVRVALVLVSLSGGVGVVAYVLGWLFIPREGEHEPIAQRALRDRLTIGLAATVVPLVIAVELIGSAVGASWLTSFAWTLLVGAAGIVLVWRNASASERAALERTTRPVADLASGTGRLRRLFLVRLLLGLGLFVAGLVELSDTGRALAAVRPLEGLLLVAGALVLVFGPWWLRLARELVSERQARARAEERAEMASRVHDSVLQTLALIQRRADEPQQVVRLARAQERELRSWLFDGSSPGSPADADTMLSAAVRRLQDDVEAAHGVSVEAVVVGDHALDARVAGLVAAAREATVNSAKWSGSPVVSLYAEVDDTAARIFVRDTGRGFSREDVPADRKGISESIEGRMARLGGTASIRSADGRGTEVHLHLPLPAATGSRR